MSLENWQDVLTEADIRRYDPMTDLETSSYYFDQGVFLVLMDLNLPTPEQVVGTGAIRRLEDQICELK